MQFLFLCRKVSKDRSTSMLCCWRRQVTGQRSRLRPTPRGVSNTRLLQQMLVGQKVMKNSEHWTAPYRCPLTSWLMSDVQSPGIILSIQSYKISQQQHKTAEVSHICHLVVTLSCHIVFQLKIPGPTMHELHLGDTPQTVTESPTERPIKISKLKMFK